MPRIKFSAAKIKNLKAEEKSVEYFDQSRKESGSLGIRVSPKGKMVWFVMYLSAGKVKRYTLGTYPSMLLKAARKAASKVMVQVDEGKDPQAKKVAYKSAETFDDLWKYYLTAPGLGKKIKRFTDKAASTQREDKRKYDRHLKDSLGPMKLVDIKQDHVELVLESLSDKTASANRLFALLGVLFKHAAYKRWITHSPLPVVFGGTETPRDRTLSRTELKAVWPELEGLTGMAYKMVLLTGQRPGQVLGAEWSEIDLEDGLWIIPRHRTKTKKDALVVPLSDQMVELLEYLENDSEYVFPAKSSTGYMVWTWRYRDEVKKRSGVHGWTAHDLRRTARTMLSKIGVDPWVAELCIGHAQAGIVKTYDIHDWLVEKKRAFQKLADEIDKINGKKKKAEIVQIKTG
jgi:integrase